MSKENSEEKPMLAVKHLTPDEVYTKTKEVADEAGFSLNNKSALYDLEISAGDNHDFGFIKYKYDNPKREFARFYIYQAQVDEVQNFLIKWLNKMGLKNVDYHLKDKIKALINEKDEAKRAEGIALSDGNIRLIILPSKGYLYGAGIIEAYLLYLD